jgi:DNA-directed RNA polymerase subunit F
MLGSAIVGKYADELEYLNCKYEELEGKVYMEFLKNHEVELDSPSGDAYLSLEDLDRNHMKDIAQMDRDAEEQIREMSSLDPEKVGEILNDLDRRLVERDEEHFSQVAEILKTPELRNAYENECKSAMNSESGIPAQYSNELKSLNKTYLDATSNATRKLKLW